MPQGECNCGAVAFEISTGVADVYVCHCSICRRFTGSGGIAVVIVDNDAFRWISGDDQVSAWTKPATDWSGFFCRRCGSPVPGPNDDSRMFVPASLLTDGTDQLRVAHHIWVNSRAEWEEIGNAGRRHPESYSE